MGSQQPLPLYIPLVHSFVVQTFSSSCSPALSTFGRDNFHFCLSLAFQVIFYDADGGMERTFDYSSDPSCREFTTAAFNPTGDAVVLGNYDSFHVFAHSHRRERRILDCPCYP